jgi:hypothetical protein
MPCEFDFGSLRVDMFMLAGMSRGINASDAHVVECAMELAVATAQKG